MSEQLSIWRDAAIGETREALIDQEGRVIALNILRRSEEGARARWGETYVARVAEIDRRRRGAFLNLGLHADQGFLPLDAGGLAQRGNERVALKQGQGVLVEIVRERARAKSPVVKLLEIGRDGEKPHRAARPECDTELADAKPAAAMTRENIDAAIEDALARHAPIPGGGVLSIEPTSALVAIDVDAAGRQGAGDPEQYALDLNIAAAKEAARQIRLRNLGGVIAIDFVSMRANAHRAKLEAAVREAFKPDPWSVQFGVLSKFGVFELARAQLRTPLHEMLCEPDRRLSPETVALQALRAIEREARTTSGRQIACTVSADVKAWLDGAAFDWRAELSNRIGLRWTLDAAPQGALWPRERIDARAR